MADPYEDNVDTAVTYLVNEHAWYRFFISNITCKNPINIIYKRLSSEAADIKRSAGIRSTVKWNRVAVRIVSHYCDINTLAYRGHLLAFKETYDWFRIEDYLPSKSDQVESYPTNPCMEIKLSGPEKCSLPHNEETKKENPMKNTFETKHYVDGVDVTELSEDQLINKIGNLEAEVRKLQGIEADSKAIKNKIKTLQKGIKFVVDHLDKR